MRPAVQSPLPHLKIRAGARRSPIDFREIARHHDLLLGLAARDVKVRYKQTAIGVLWVVLQPLMAAAIFAFVFGLVARMPSYGRPYLLFAFAGLLAWNLFSSTLSRASTALLANSQLVTKVYFPRLILPLSTVISTLLDFAVSLGVMLILLVLYRVRPGPGILLLPVWVAILVVMALGIGLIAGALTVRFRDVQHMIPVLLTMGMYASPVAWTVAAVPARYRLVPVLNPLTGLLEAFRWSLLGEGILSGPALLSSTAVALATFWLGARVFRQMERSFADVL